MINTGYMCKVIKNENFKNLGQNRQSRNSNMYTNEDIKNHVTFDHSKSHISLEMSPNMFENRSKS